MLHWLLTITIMGAAPSPQSDSLIQSSAATLLYAVKTGKPTTEVIQTMTTFHPDQLQSALQSDEAKKAFWLNMYNAWFQLLAAKHPNIGKKIFSIRAIPIAGQLYSLDQIEHGILRKYRWKYSLGYLPDLFTKRSIRKMAVHKIDYRIHFALNCGAKSCPPIAFYRADKIDQQLTLAMKIFLQQETNIDTTKRTVTTTKIIQWFIGDFGGRKKVLELLSTITGKDLTTYQIKYSPYDWTQQLLYFQEPVQ
jgi:Protein of unknown function, DUF547